MENGEMRKRKTKIVVRVLRCSPLIVSTNVIDVNTIKQERDKTGKFAVIIIL